MKSVATFTMGTTSALIVYHRLDRSFININE